MDQYIGKLLDNRYEILERIGTGGMAVVYKARCHRLNRLVAVKILKEDLAQDADFRRRFHDESQAVAMLSHPNIMAVYDVSRSSDIDYIVMELIDGITLKQYMQKKGGKLSWRESLHFITQIMKALSHAHSRGIIHRDIKPHNIMVLRDGSVKVTDFGIARLTSAAQSTLTQEALGSVHYISPEQARGSHIDARSDIYSAGVVLYEMITGRLPYEGDSPVSVAIQHINSIPLAPRELEDDIPEALEAITLKAMASDVSQRYISADAMLGDLEEFRKNPNINFDFGPADISNTDVDEPTQVLGSNTPSTVHTQPTHVPRRSAEEESSLRRRSNGSRPASRETSQDTEDDYYNERPRRRQGGSAGPVIAAVGAIVVFIVVIGFFLYTAFIKDILNPATAIVAPDLTDRTLSEAQEFPYINENNILIVEGEYEASNTVTKDHIIRQDPEPNSALPSSNLTITVTISSGAEEVKIPDYFGKDARTAELELKGMGYEVEIETDNSEEVTEGCVMSQFPVADTVLTPGQKVRLIKSLGRETKKVTVPSFIGLTIDDAKRIAANDLNLKVEIDRKYSSEIVKDYIIQQSITPNTEVDEGSKILFIVSDGADPALSPTPTPSPDVPPSPSPSNSPIPPPVTTATKQFTINLPQDGRGTVAVRIKVGNDDYAFYNPSVETQMKTISPNVTAPVGDQVVIIYIDEVEDQKFTEQF